MHRSTYLCHIYVYSWDPSTFFSPFLWIFWYYEYILNPAAKFRPSSKGSAAAPKHRQLHPAAPQLAGDLFGGKSQAPQWGFSGLCWLFCQHRLERFHVKFWNRQISDVMFQVKFSTFFPWFPCSQNEEKQIPQDPHATILWKCVMYLPNQFPCQRRKWAWFDMIIKKSILITRESFHFPPNASPAVWYFILTIHQRQMLS